MRIVFVNGRSWPAVGGVESFLRDLSRALAREHGVTVLAQRIDDGPTRRLTESLRPPPSFEPFEDGGVRIEPVRIPRARRALLAPLAGQVVPGLRRYAYTRPRAAAAQLYARVVAPLLETRFAGADVVHVMGGGMLGEAAVRAARTVGARVVITPFVHRGEWGDDHASGLLYRRADQVVALLESDARVYRELGVRPEQIVRCGLCSPGVTSGGGDELRQRHGIDGPLVLFLGVRRDYKGYDVLLEAARLAAPRLRDAWFAFVGPGEPLPATPELRVIDRPEAVVDPERSAWVDAADLLCLPSRGEVTPLSLLEAWSVGTPALTSDLDTLTELMRASGGGVAVPREPQAVADALVELLADPARLHALGEAGNRYWREHHSVAAVAREHAALYASLAARREERAA